MGRFLTVDGWLEIWFRAVVFKGEDLDRLENEGETREGA